MKKRVKQISLREDKDSNREIKKHSSMVQLGGFATLIERKLINAAIRITKDQLKRNPNQLRFTTELGNFKRLIGYKDSKNDDLKEALRNLRRTEFEYNILHKDGEKWGNFSYFSDVEIETRGRGRTAYVSREYPSRVLNVIQHPKMFVRLNLLVIMGLNSKHSVVLYEFLKDYVGLWKINTYIQDFRELMGLQKGQYVGFSMLKKRVLENAVNEVNEKTDLQVSYEVERIGRQVRSLTFYMKLKKHRLDLFPNSEEIKKKLQYFGLKEKQIKALLKKHDQQYLRANIAVVEQEAQKGTIKNLPAYLLKAFANDYRPLETEYDKEQQQIKAKKKEETERVEQEQEQLKERQAAFEQRKREAIKERLSRLSKTEFDTYKEAFLSGTIQNDFFAKVLDTKGFETSIIQLQWNKYLAPILLSESENSFEWYCENHLSS